MQVQMQDIRWFVKVYGRVPPRADDELVRQLVIDGPLQDLLDCRHFLLVDVDRAHRDITFPNEYICLEITKINT